MATKQDLIDEFRGTYYPDCPESWAEVYFDRCSRTVLRALRVRNGSYDLSLTDGVQEYDLPTTFLAVREAYYAQGESRQNWTPIAPVSLDQLARGEFGWQQAQTTSMPFRYYLSSATSGSDGESKLRIGFAPIPDTTTSAGYPVAKLFGTVYSVPDSTAEFYSGLTSDTVVLLSMAYQWALAQDRESAAKWMALYNAELAAQSKQLREMAEGAPSLRILNPMWGRNRQAV